MASDSNEANTQSQDWRSVRGTRVDPFARLSLGGGKLHLPTEHERLWLRHGLMACYRKDTAYEWIVNADLAKLWREAYPTLRNTFSGAYSIYLLWRDECERDGPARRYAECVFSTVRDRLGILRASKPLAPVWAMEFVHEDVTERDVNRLLHEFKNRPKPSKSGLRTYGPRPSRRWPPVPDVPGFSIDVGLGSVRAEGLSYWDVEDNSGETERELGVWFGEVMPDVMEGFGPEYWDALEETAFDLVRIGLARLRRDVEERFPGRYPSSITQQFEDLPTLASVLFHRTKVLDDAQAKRLRRICRRLCIKYPGRRRDNS